ncbi:TraB/GumN family protein [Chitinophaga polysaccharea]|uniref:TraB/GumN family protein n=1 Tax=Chitinophaga polysaccharea TaxID=1293035 RepID=UPI0014552845|nr:TraB/GumN family protein [Chitinophaga polysaccharea]NLR60958.1 TraB/GumN family protein [Chitinophaga polysaccharea]
MQYIIKTIGLLAIVFVGLFTGNANGQQQPLLEKSLLWKVTGKGLTQPSYLYGTIHMICDADFKIATKTKNAFEQASQLVLEADLFNPSTPALVKAAMTADTPLSKKLSPTEYTMLDSLMQQKMGMTLKPFDNFKLTMVMALMAQKLFSCAQPKSYEMTFNQMATVKKLPVGALETVQEQLDLMNKAFSDEQIITQVKGFDSARIMMNEMVENYKAEDVGALYNRMVEELTDKHTIQIMLEERNLHWVTEMPEMMQKGSSFFAVGAGHLGGPIGIITLLRKQGYTVTPVMN